MRSVQFLAIGLCLMAAVLNSSAEEFNQVYKMCVPQKYYEDCLTILKDPSEAGIKMECISGRDRIECLELINQRKADILAVDPEDMYVAYHMKNEDFRVISEIRNKDEQDAEFRYEGVILVKKTTKANSLKDLQGLNSCHTGFGRNVGYKIPITKLKNGGVLKVNMDPQISATERELSALSEFFSKSCLVGKYSPNPEINQKLKKKFSNLCALCEDPVKCDYPDKYSGYNGAIGCLDKGDGDVAFTKVSYIKKYFGLNGDKAEGNPDDFEYLCEDGSRRPITGPACSWAQRPWKGYISNTDNVRDSNYLGRLQKRLDTFFSNGLEAQNKEAAAHLLIDTQSILHEKPQSVDPKEYLERAGYKDVIERDGSISTKARFCLSHQIEFEKCETLRSAAYSRDIRPEFECILDENCIAAVKDGKADIVALQADRYHEAKDSSLMPIVYESFGDDNVYVAVVEPTLNKELLEKTPVKFEKTNLRARYAALLLNKKRGLKVCDDLPDVPTDELMIVNSKDLSKYQNKQLLCDNLEKKPVTEFRTCNFEANLPTAVFIRTNMSPVEKDGLVNAFASLSDKFGSQGTVPDVFKIFGLFKDDFFNVIFDDDAVKFETKITNPNVNEEIYNELSCKN